MEQNYISTVVNGPIEGRDIHEMTTMGETELLQLISSKKRDPELVFEKAQKVLGRKGIILKGVIGAGGFGVVTEGEMDIIIDGNYFMRHPVAVKVPYPLLFFGNTEDVEKNEIRVWKETFYGREIYDSLRAREAKLGEALKRHLERHVVRSYLGGKYDGIHYSISELVRGRDLGKYGRLKIGDILQIGITLCFILEVAHEQGIVHRDIKPGNILVPDDILDDIKLGDFGLAKKTEVIMPYSKALVGSPSFTAPEQFIPDWNVLVDSRADIYSVGATLYYLVTGVPPRTKEQIDGFTRGQKLPMLSYPHEFREVPYELEEVIMTSLLEPERRYQTIAKMNHALQQVRV